MAPGPVPANSIWGQMNYVPPRGACHYKTGIMTTCPCMRFMLHPLKSTTSFECDGCAHHASFHSMDNPREDEIVKRWEMEEKEREQKEQLSTAQAERPKKRSRKAIEGNNTTVTAARTGAGEGLLATFRRGLLGDLDDDGEGFVVGEVDGDSESTVGVGVSATETGRRRGGGRKR